jgi:hypothetical protein
MNLTPFVILWSILALAVLALALYRKLMANHEDDLIHVGPGQEKLIPQQIQMAAKLEVVDRWGKILTVIIAAAGLLIAAVYLYQALEASLKRAS